MRKLLLMLLLFSTTANYKTYSFDCGSSKCSCQQQKNGQIFCFSRKNDVRIVFDQNSRKLMIECTLSSNFDLNTINVTSAYRVDKVQIQYCIQPSIMFRNLQISNQVQELTLLNVRNVTPANEFLNELHNLGMLAIYGPINKLKIIGNGLLPKLKKLDLKQSALQSLGPELFKNMPNLQSITLQKNKITDLQSSTFYELKMLSNLNLNDNRLTKLPPDLFKNSANLEHLVLSENSLNVLSKEQFYYNTNLTTLGLTYADITELPADIFRANKKLKRIFLRGNENLHLKDSFALDLPALETLTMSYCNLAELPGYFFKGSWNLKQINLSNNRLGRLPVGIFSSLIRLESLNLMENRFEELPDDTFAGLVALNDLDLSVNRLRTINDLILRDLVQLRTLNLNNNFLETITDGAFANLKQLNTLHLGNNSIKTVSENVFKFLTKGRRRNFDLTANPIRCDCDLYGFAKLLHENDKVFHDLRCESPPDLTGSSLKSLNLSLLCPPTCPDPCFCYVANPDKAFVDCSNRSLNQAPKLGLGGNKIKELAWIPPGIEVLILSNDSLQRIEAGILHGPNRSSSVKHLDFQKNPWTCDCSTLEFATFIRQQTKSFKIKGASVQCAADGRLLADLYLKDLCVKASGEVWPTWAQISLSALLIILLVALLVVLGCYWRKRKGRKGLKRSVSTRRRCSSEPTAKFEIYSSTGNNSVFEENELYGYGFQN